MSIGLTPSLQQPGSAKSAVPKPRPSGPLTQHTPRPSVSTLQPPLADKLSPTIANTAPMTKLIDSVPRDAPNWVSTSLRMFEAKDFGEGWKLAVTAWYRFEEKHAFKAGSHLGCSGRPPIVACWIQLAQDPLITQEKAGSTTLMGIDTAFWTWWAGLQPPWKSVSSDKTPREVKGGWTALDKSGANGLLSVIATLHLWRQFGLEEELASWDRVLDDIHWVIQQLLTL